jgi:hypothetical protein
MTNHQTDYDGVIRVTARERIKITETMVQTAPNTFKGLDR